MKKFLWIITNFLKIVGDVLRFFVDDLIAFTVL